MPFGTRPRRGVIVKEVDSGDGKALRPEALVNAGKGGAGPATGVAVEEIDHERSSGEVVEAHGSAVEVGAIKRRSKWAIAATDHGADRKRLLDRGPHRVLDP